MYIKIFLSVSFDSAVQEYLFECEVKKLTWKTIRGYKNNLEFVTNYLQQEHSIEMIEDIKTVHLKSFFMYQRELHEQFIKNL